MVSEVVADLGSYEAEQKTHDHFNQGREIQPRVVKVPFYDQTTSSDYKAWDLPERTRPREGAPARQQIPFDGTSTSHSDFKAWDLPPREAPPAPSGYPRGHIPFDGSTTYSSQFPAHPVQARATPNQRGPGGPHTVPFTATSTYADTYLAPPPAQPSGLAPSRPPPPTSSVPFEGQSSYTLAFPMPPPPALRSSAMPLPPPARPHVPFDATTTHKSDFVAHPVQPRTPPGERGSAGDGSKVPFQGISEAQDKFRAWDLPPAGTNRPTQMPPRAQTPFTAETTHGSTFKGWQLPAARGTLGVETVGGGFHPLIRASQSEPAFARALFTTVHDNQQEVCIVVLQGESNKAQANRVLGRFDLVGIPPAPAQLPQIEVTFKLSGDLILQVEAIDLDTGRHADWKQQKGRIVVHQ